MRGQTRVAVLAVAAAAVSSLSALSALPAAADSAVPSSGTAARRHCATGTQSWNSQTVPGVPVPIPAGALDHVIYCKSSDGRKITKETAGFETLFRNVCNWRIDFRYYTLGGRLYKTSKGSTHRRCQHTGSRTRSKDFTLKSGRACAQLRVSGKAIATQCHNISRH
jgi:hypothetical protein